MDRGEGGKVVAILEEGTVFEAWMIVGEITPDVSCVDVRAFRMEVAATIMSTSLDVVPFILTAMAIAS